MPATMDMTPVIAAQGSLLLPPPPPPPLGQLSPEQGAPPAASEMLTTAKITVTRPRKMKTPTLPPLLPLMVSMLYLLAVRRKMFLHLRQRCSDRQEPRRPAYRDPWKTARTGPAWGREHPSGPYCTCRRRPGRPCRTQGVRGRAVLAGVRLWRDLVLEG